MRLILAAIMILFCSFNVQAKSYGEPVVRYYYDIEGVLLQLPDQEDFLPVLRNLDFDNQVILEFVNNFLNQYFLEQSELSDIRLFAQSDNYQLMNDLLFCIRELLIYFEDQLEIEENLFELELPAIEQGLLIEQRQEQVARITEVQILINNIYGILVSRQRNSE